MEQKFYICKHCGNIIAKVKDSGVPIVCCGEEMTEIIPGTTDAAVEKHVPIWTVENGIVHVKVVEESKGRNEKENRHAEAGKNFKKSCQMGIG